jgi:hypothetical protein
MAATETIDINIQVKIDQLKAELEKIPGISKKSAEGMAKSYSREYASMEKAAAKAGREAEKAADRTRDAWKGSAERVASLMGGTFGDISDSIFDLGERLSGIATGASGLTTVMAGTAAGVTALGFAAAFAGKATHEWLLTLPGTIQSLKEWEGITPVTAAELDAITSYTERTSELGAVVDRTAVLLGSELSPGMEKVATVMLGLVDVMSGAGGVIDSMQSVSSTIGDVMLPVSRVLSLGLSDLATGTYGLLIDRGDAVAASMERVTDQMRGLNDEIRQTNDEAREMLVALGLLDEDEGPVAYTRAAREAEVVTRDWAAAQRMLADESSRASIAAAQAQADATAAALQRQSQEWEAYAERTAATQVQIQESITAIEAEYAAQRQEAQTLALQMGAETALQTIGDVAQLQLDALEKEVQARQDAHKAAVTQLKSQRDIVREQLESGKISAATAREKLAAIDTELKATRKANRETRAEQNAQIERAFKAQKIAAKGTAIMNTATAYLGFLATFAALGPGAPFAAAAITGPALKVQLAAINAQSPPKFAIGGMVGDRVQGSADHVTIAATPKEAVLTERGVSAAGGPKGVDALNGGGSMGGGVAAVYLDREMIGAAVVSVIESDSRVQRALDQRAGLVAGHRARYSARG